MYISPQFYYASGWDYGIQAYPSHSCLVAGPSENEKPYYKALLDFYLQLKPKATYHDCGNHKCLIEQIKNHESRH